MKNKSWKEKYLSFPYVFNFISYLSPQPYHKNNKSQKYFIGSTLTQDEFKNEFCTSEKYQPNIKENYNQLNNFTPGTTLDEETKAKHLSTGLLPKEQEIICQEWKNGKFWCNSTKYKSVLKKIKPINVPMPQGINPPLQQPPLSRDPYLTPLTPHPPEFSPTLKITEEKL